jgi:hypothetical protein
VFYKNLWLAIDPILQPRDLTWPPDIHLSYLLFNQKMDDRYETCKDTEESSQGSTPPSSPIVDVENLVSRAKSILSELEAFRDRLKTLRKEGEVDIAHYRAVLRSELASLEKLTQRPESESKNHVARSSNLPYMETIWSTAKGSLDTTALLKRVYFDIRIGDATAGIKPKSVRNSPSSKHKKSSQPIIIDAITDNGRLWTKVSLATNARLLFDLAKEGWVSENSDDDDDDDQGRLGDRGDDDPQIPLVKTAKQLSKAAKAFRAQTHIPKIQLVLPHIQLGETPEVDRIIDNCRQYGVTILCGEDMQPPPELETALKLMAPDPRSSFSDVLNIDCTILLALVSEFSHAKVSKEPWFHSALQRQVEIEDNENLLPSLLYPTLGSHQLVCTSEAAKRMREIVDTIGTPSEKARTSIFMGDDGSKTRVELLKELQEWSAYLLPSDLQLPIQVVEYNEHECKLSLSNEAIAASEGMTAINQSVFLYGWSTGRTTISSNRTVIRELESQLGNYENLDDNVWPKIWLCPTARSLVGKEKRGAERKATKPWPLPDPLRREAQRRNGLDVLGIREGRKVEDLRPDGYDYEDVIAAKLNSLR